MTNLYMTDVKIYRTTIPKDNWLLVAIETNEGLTGWGEITGNLNDAGATAYIKKFAEENRGKDVLNLIDLTQNLYKWNYPDLRENRIFVSAYSGIDQALWDLQAQAMGVPLYELLGARGNTTIPLYANLNKALWGDRSAEALQRSGEEAYKQGFSFVKCTPFDEVKPDSFECNMQTGLERFAALIEKVPIEKVAIDCHDRFNHQHFTQLVDTLLRDYGVPYWIEGPMSPHCNKELRMFRQRYPQLTIVGGEECIGYRQALECIQSGLYDLFMPDLKYIGGISVTKTLIEVCNGLQHLVSLHSPNGPVSSAHGAHVSALNRIPFPMEFPSGSAPERQQALTFKEPVVNGNYILSDRPGIGLAPTPEFLKECGELL